MIIQFSGGLSEYRKEYITIRLARCNKGCSSPLSQRKLKQQSSLPVFAQGIGSHLQRGSTRVTVNTRGVYDVFALHGGRCVNTAGMRVVLLTIIILLSFLGLTVRVVIACGKQLRVHTLHSKNFKLTGKSVSRTPLSKGSSKEAHRQGNRTLGDSPV